MTCDDLNLKIMEMLGKGHGIFCGCQADRCLRATYYTIGSTVDIGISTGLHLCDNNRLGYSHLAYMGINIECGF
jgi:hypothetical protein